MNATAQIESPLSQVALAIDFKPNSKDSMLKLETDKEYIFSEPKDGERAPRCTQRNFQYRFGPNTIFLERQ